MYTRVCVHTRAYIYQVVSFAGGTLACFEMHSTVEYQGVGLGSRRKVNVNGCCPLHTLHTLHSLHTLQTLHTLRICIYT